jgi:hypothetical protein
LRNQHDNPDRETREPRVARSEAPAVDAGVLAGRGAPPQADRSVRRQVLRLQRSAGNAAVSRLLRRPRSPVLDVVGRGGGQPLDAGVRQQMEGALREDFSEVRVHMGSEASRSARSVQAQAYTVADEIVFGDSAYAPGTADGDRRLAHELTHVVQQRRGPVDGTPQGEGIAVSDPSDRFEQAATANADRVMARLAHPGTLTRHRGAARASAELGAVAQRATVRAGSAVTVQRDEQSAALLKKLATPKVGEGPAIKVQQQLVSGLDTIYDQKFGDLDVDLQPPTVKLGGVLIDWLPDANKTYMPTAGDTAEAKQQRKDDVQALYMRIVRNPFASQFVNLDTNDPKGAAIGQRIGAEVKQAGLGPAVVENTVKTMLDAGQFEYLRLAGLPNKDWKILVEMHYIRFRPKDMAGFHKDTEGQSLFVNLNYHVPGHKLRGPEYVLNPPKSEEHDKVIYGTPAKDGTSATEGTLPKQFTEDLTKLRDQLPTPQNIESAGTVEGLGYVAFVDEAVHHATPWFGHRYVTPSEFKAYLGRKVKADNKYQAWQARRETTKKTSKRGYSPLLSTDERDDLASFSEYVKEKERENVKAKPAKAGYSRFEDEPTSFSDSVNMRTWKAWLKMATVRETREEKRDRAKKYTREDFAATMRGNDFDLMLEDVGSQPEAERQKAGAAGWYAASIPKAGETPIRPKDKPPLTRTASSADLTRGWPDQLPNDVPRRFIRSWVRAVPESYAAKLRS